MSLRPCRGCSKGVSPDAKVCPHCGQPKPGGGSERMRLGCAVACMVVVAWIGIWSIYRSIRKQPTDPAWPRGRWVNDEVRDSLRLSKYTWSKGGFGGVFIGTFTVVNSSHRDVRDLEFTCSHVAPSGTAVGSSRQTVLDIVKATKTRTFRDVNMGFIDPQAASTNCEITGFVVVP